MLSNFKKGLTSLETVIVIVIMIFILAGVVVGFSRMRASQALQNAGAEVVSVLNKASSQTLASLDSSEYGVHFESDKVIIFKGTTYSAVDPDNEQVDIASPATISNISLTGGAVDVYFNRLTSLPSVTGTVTVSTSVGTKTITISATGVISISS